VRSTRDGHDADVLEAEDRDRRAVRHAAVELRRDHLQQRHVLQRRPSGRQRLDVAAQQARFGTGGQVPGQIGMGLGTGVGDGRERRDVTRIVHSAARSDREPSVRPVQRVPDGVVERVIHGTGSGLRHISAPARRRAVPPTGTATGTTACGRAVCRSPEIDPAPTTEADPCRSPKRSRSAAMPRPGKRHLCRRRRT
jgi:hypothetical protein